METSEQSSVGLRWVPFFEELATKLSAYETRQRELIDFLERLRADGNTITSMRDRDATGATFLIGELDPFTFLAVVNRGISADKRVRILAAMKEFFRINADVPKDFSGIPVLNNQNSWFMSFIFVRKASDVPVLWNVFKLALHANAVEDPDFAAAFDAAIAVRNIHYNLTMGLFWIRPRSFISLDKHMREHLKLDVPTEGLTSGYYLPLLRKLSAEHPEGFAAFSHAAWLASSAPEVANGYGAIVGTGTRVREPLAPATSINYWMVGAWWDDRDPNDQTQRFREQGIWENGFKDKLKNEVRSMRPGDRIAIKAAATQKRDLPFDYRGQTASKMLIRATGTIMKNLGDGKVVEVDWDPAVSERSWYFYTGRSTVWKLDASTEYAKCLIRFAFEGEEQDYAYWLREWERDGRLEAAPALDAESVAEPYSIDDLLAEGVFLKHEQLESILRRLTSKKNLILDGAPGVGKTFLARRLAFALMQERDASRIVSVQFHPSYSYEDFVRGYRPTGSAGTLSLQDGPLMEACRLASERPSEPVVLLIDEVNRGNTSQIFGELLALIEADKRGDGHAVMPIYRRQADERLSVPENLYFIGTMNLADRSLALVDYALRRRFAFVSLQPQFSSVEFRSWHATRGMTDALLNRITSRMNELNGEIAADTQLGPNFRIGHSFFCPRGTDFTLLTDEWYLDVVETEIVPLLNEYWFDSKDKVEQASARLKAL